jgi:hypothetical protein
LRIYVRRMEDGVDGSGRQQFMAFLGTACRILLGLIDALLRVDFDSCFSYLIRSRDSVDVGAPHF